MFNKFKSKITMAVVLVTPLAANAWYSCDRMFDCATASCFLRNFADCIGGTIVNYF